MTLLFTLRTANRAPKHNYLGLTLDSLARGGTDPARVHVVCTDPDVRWIGPQLPIGMLGVRLHAWTPRTPNENGLAQIDLLDQYPADWIVMSEDDLEWCAAPLESIAAWLERYASPAYTVYRFFTFGPCHPIDAHCGQASLHEQRGSQAVALRADDARSFARWARAHPRDWRPPGAPFQHRPHDGFDKLIGYWALQHDPGQRMGLVSRPFFVRHLGTASSIHGYGVTRDSLFAGARWRFPPEAVCR